MLELLNLRKKQKVSKLGSFKPPIKSLLTFVPMYFSNSGPCTPSLPPDCQANGIMGTLSLTTTSLPGPSTARTFSGLFVNSLIPLSPHRHQPTGEDDEERAGHDRPTQFALADVVSGHLFDYCASNKAHKKEKEKYHFPDLVYWTNRVDLPFMILHFAHTAFYSGSLLHTRIKENIF